MLRAINSRRTKMGNKNKRRAKTKNRPENTSRKGQSKPAKSNKIHVLIVVVAILAIGGYFFYRNNLQVRATQGEVSSHSPASTASLRGGERRPTLRPSLFTGKIARAYAIAEENAELIDSLYCYCNCKPNFGHKSLLTCYVDRHAENCDICLGEALYANSLFKEGVSIAKVRKAVDQKFWRPLR
jgi:hypothetical protein